eukprot:scaffold13537_cov115-Isochrysis_galbana.AAC.4
MNTTAPPPAPSTSGTTLATRSAPSTRRSTSFYSAPKETLSRRLCSKSGRHATSRSCCRCDPTFCALKIVGHTWAPLHLLSPEGPVRTATQRSRDAGFARARKAAQPFRPFVWSGMWNGLPAPLVQTLSESSTSSAGFCYAASVATPQPATRLAATVPWHIRWYPSSVDL